MAAGFNKNRRYATGPPFDLLDVSRIDSKFLEILNRRGTEQIIAHPGHHEDVRAAEPGCNRLICRFTSKAEIEFLPKNGFAGFRKTVTKSSQVNICASNHCNSRTFAHRKAESSQRSRLLSMEFPHREGCSPQSHRENFIVFSLCLCDSVVKKTLMINYSP